MDESERADRERADREWAESANRVTAAPPDHQPTGTGYAGSGRGEVGTPRNLRVGRGPRFSGRGILAVFGLLGILLTVGLMALLAVRVLDSTDPVPGLPGPDVGSGGAGAPTTPTEQVDQGPPSPADAARAAECETERATVEVAALAYEVTTGSPPTDLQALVDFGVLAGPVTDLSHAIGAGGQLVATGDCAPG